MRSLKRVSVLFALPAALALAVASCGGGSHGQNNQPAGGPQAPATAASGPGVQPPARQATQPMPPKPMSPATAGTTPAPASTGGGPR